ncbi:hypothetical protein [Amycolatopsis aidingensis]|uniref:hypothetical protein n=1 Tax=Amycolatopsis aidingensis TaxID=2842453 RepID=UPI001C0CF758|nr:hypothetical protein [Amycolatopsis aidingensis]
MWIWIAIGAVVLLLVGVAIATDLRDRKRGGTRGIRMTGWLERRGRGEVGSAIVNWKTTDYRPHSPREREDQ